MKNTQVSSRVFSFQTKGSAGGAFASKSLRRGFDILAPGCNADDVTTEVNLTRSTVKVTIAANPRPPYDLEGKVDKFGYNKFKKPIVETLKFDGDKYDMSRVFVSCHNGIVRVFVVVPEAEVTLVDGKYVLDSDIIISVDAIDMD